MTGYLGGAVATHVRVGEPFGMPLVLGVVAWIGRVMRDGKVRRVVAGRG
jgi:hypothetical protein